MNVLLELDLCCQDFPFHSPAHCGPPRTQGHASVPMPTPRVMTQALILQPVPIIKVIDICIEKEQKYNKQVKYDHY